eukprot:4063524-Amphidinium_carterae.1
MLQGRPALCTAAAMPASPCTLSSNDGWTDVLIMGRNTILEWKARVVPSRSNEHSDYSQTSPKNGLGLRSPSPPSP